MENQCVRCCEHVAMAPTSTSGVTESSVYEAKFTEAQQKTIGV
ncbi:hypothetical protein [Streptomyces sp. Root431]|nr:hypothetical protein [Streptomyces sp. Root431]